MKQESSHSIAGMIHPGQRWRPAPLIAASMLLHLAAVLWLLRSPAGWPICLGIIIANHLLLTIITVMPRSALLGPNLRRLPDAAIGRREVAITFDDGPDPQVTPQVLDLLDRYSAKATFFCIGQQAVAHPELLREIVRRGHSVENHSESHSFRFGFFGAARLRREIDTAQQSITAITGCAPRYFRAPAGIHNPILDWVLTGIGLQLVSWTRRGYDPVSANPQAILARLKRNLSAGDILVLHDVSGIHGQAMVLEILPALLEEIQKAGLHSTTLSAAMRLP